MIARGGAVPTLKPQTMSREKYRKILLKYIPEPAFEEVYRLIINHRVYLNITRERKTRHGDFRPPFNGMPARISVNHNLNRYAFLITFLHELAHQMVWENHRNRVKPHGPEWKAAFAGLLATFVENGSFPPEIATLLSKNPDDLYHSTVTDTLLFRQLKKYDNHNGFKLLETLPDNSLFMLPNGSKFRKLHKRRKNFLCLNLINGRNYVFNPLAEVIPLDDK